MGYEGEPRAAGLAVQAQIVDEIFNTWWHDFDKKVKPRVEIFEEFSGKEYKSFVSPSF